MSKHPIIFMIFAPNDLNEEVVAKAAHLEQHLSMQFTGYRFEVVDLRRLRSLDPSEPVQFGDGMSFAVIPMLGATSDGDSGGYMHEAPSHDLIKDITDVCERFDFGNPKRYAA